MRVIYIFLLFLIFLIISPFFIFIIYETDRAIIENLGKLEIDSKTKLARVYEPGIHFKVPVLQVVRTFDMRLKVLDIQCSRITTKEKKDVLVDFYILWQIKDLPLYYTRTGGYRTKAEQLLKQKVIADLKAEFGRLTIQDVVYGERIELMFRLREEIEVNTRGIGISVIDVRVKRIDLPDEVRDSVYLRMRAERERVASETRANGRSEAIKINAEADRERRIILAKAVKDSKRIKGEGDAEAARIYADAYNLDPDFYEFYRTLEAYKNSFYKKDDLLILTPDGDFFKYFKNKGF